MQAMQAETEKNPSKSREAKNSQHYNNIITIF